MRTLTVHDPKLAASLASARGNHFLAPYFDGPCAVAEAAAYVHESLAKTHYWTRRWLALGALKVVDEVPRGGRAIKLYRTTADVFVVPPELLPESQLALTLERVNREMLDALETAAPEVAFGGELQVSKAPGQRHVSTNRGPAGRLRRDDTLHCNFEIALTPDQAAAACKELEALRDKWVQRADDDAKTTHLFVLAMAPVTGR